MHIFEENSTNNKKIKHKLDPFQSHRIQRHVHYLRKWSHLHPEFITQTAYLLPAVVCFILFKELFHMF